MMARRQSLRLGKMMEEKDEMCLFMMPPSEGKAVFRRKSCANLIEYIQKERVIHVFTKILYAASITHSEQILIEKFSEAWIKYKARNAEDRTDETL
jgi:hypothetical protein